jgi:putative ABC transport system ATP-binding protein
MNEDIITLTDISKIYVNGDAKLIAVDSVSMTIPKGSMVVLTGPSGSGKSTLLYIMAGLMKPSHGEVYIKGESIYSLPDDSISRLRKDTIGFVFQAFNLIPTLTAIENIMASRIMDKDKRYEKALELLEDLNLSSHKNHLPTELSGGEQQKIAIARALINDPDIILADEPTGNLDSKNGEKIAAILHGLHSRGKTVIVATHAPKLFKAEGTLNISIVDGHISPTLEGGADDGK